MNARKSPAVSPAAASRRASAATVAAFSLGIVLLGGAALGAGFRAATVRVDRTRDRIAPGVMVAGLPVGGMTPDEAREKVRAWAQERMQRPVTFVAPQSHRTWNLTLADAGGRFSVDPAVDKAFAIGKDAGFWDTLMRGDRPWNVRIQPEFALNTRQIDRELALIARQVNREPRSAKAHAAAGGVLELTQPAEPGVTLDVAATHAALLKDGPQSLADGGRTNLIIRETRPAITADDLGKVNTLLASFHTSFGSSSPPRRHNVELAASKIDGTLLAPGEVFSYNRIVGPREPNLGWLDAPTYQDGQVVPGPGGGVCQVSTTLYNAALRAGLKIVRRSHHSMPVHYVNPGCDATVAYDDIDFRFENSTPGPLLVAADTTGGTLKFNLYGEAPDKPFKADVVSGDRKENPDGSFTVTTYRVTTYADGTTNREHLSTDTYEPYHPPTAAPTPKRKATPTPTPAATPGI